MSFGEEAGNPVACVVAIVLYGVYILMEPINKLAVLCFIFSMLVWGIQVNPAVLNRCHVPLWFAVFLTFRNCFLVESHATMSWGFSMLGSVYGSAMH
jgi:hypothetical protein